MALAIRVTARRALSAVGAGAVVGATLFAAAPSASADLPPNCTAGDLAQVATGVSAAMSVYLYSHPDVNAFFTGLQDCRLRPSVRGSPTTARPTHKFRPS